jgi:hypothetical protein
LVDVELIGDLDSVPAPVATGIYRLVQEAVTMRGDMLGGSPASTSASPPTTPGCASG